MRKNELSIDLAHDKLCYDLIITLLYRLTARVVARELYVECTNVFVWIEHLGHCIWSRQTKTEDIFIFTRIIQIFCNHTELNKFVIKSKCSCLLKLGGQYYHMLGINNSTTPKISF